MLTKNKGHIKSISLLTLTLSVLSILLYHSTITLFPAFTHSWTQSERYALALGFLHNGFDLFHPSTFNLQSIDGITRVDFPINEYIVAIIMKLISSTSPAIFRIYTLSLSITGLIFLYLLTKKITSSEIKSWLVVLFVFLSPVYVYYQAGFIPSVPAIAFIFIAYYFFFSYKDTNKNKHFYLSVTFFLLAALIRIPFLIFLFSALLHQAWLIIKHKKIKWFEISAFIVAFSLFAAYYRYNVHLGRMYGNMFLDSFLPARNIKEFKDILLNMYTYWKFQYFTKAHYYLLFAALLYSLYTFIRHRGIPEKDKKYWFHLFIMGSGATLYFLLMMCQFYDHDYYFLDSLFIPIVFLFICSINNIKLESKAKKVFWSICLLIAVLYFFKGTVKVQKERYTTYEWDRVEASRQNFTGIDKYMDSIGISKDAKILVIESYSTNIPLILMNRKGYTVYQTNRDDAFMPLFKYDWDYVAIQDVFLVSDVLNYYPILNSLLEKVAGNGKISFYKKSAVIKSKTLKNFLSISPENTVYSSIVKFDTAQHDEHIKTADNTSEEKSYSTPKAGALNETVEYGTSLYFKAKELKQKNLKILVTAYIFCDKPITDLQCVASVSNSNEALYYQSFDLNKQIKQIGKWQKMELQFVLPPFKNAEDELKIYLWNKNKEIIYYDNLEFIIYH
ncbi:MAG: glycosyltransferase family 39 protein [Bacteroidota bacterium]